jgi:hypothetical protein
LGANQKLVYLSSLSNSTLKGESFILDGTTERAFYIGSSSQLNVEAD